MDWTKTLGLNRTDFRMPRIWVQILHLNLLSSFCIPVFDTNIPTYFTNSFHMHPFAVILLYPSSLEVYTKFNLKNKSLWINMMIACELIFSILSTSPIISNLWAVQCPHKTDNFWSICGDIIWVSRWLNCSLWNNIYSKVNLF